MGLDVSKNIITKIIVILLLGVSVFFMVLNYKRILDISYSFIVSIFIAYLLNPIVSRMEHKGIKRGHAILIIYIFTILIVIFICFYIIPAMIKDIGKLIQRIPQYNIQFMNTIQYIQEKYSNSALPLAIKNVIDNNINKIQNSIVSYLETISSLIISLLSKAFNFILIPILLYYFLKDYNKIGQKTLMLIPRKYRSEVKRICSNIDDVFGNYIRSQIILSIIIAVLTSIVLLILKIDFALIIGILNGITNIIPYFGPIIGAVPAVTIAFLQSPSKALYTLIAMTVIQQIESDIISPKITADIVGLHPITVILSLIIGGEFFGAMGLILGVPIAAALKVIYRDIMKNMF